MRKGFLLKINPRLLDKARAESKGNLTAFIADAIKRRLDDLGYWPTLTQEEIEEKRARILWDLKHAERALKVAKSELKHDAELQIKRYGKTTFTPEYQAEILKEFEEVIEEWKKKLPIPESEMTDDWVEAYDPDNPRYIG